MPDYEMDCPQCKNTLEFPDSLLNQNVECPECGNVLTLMSPPAVPAGAVAPPVEENFYQQAPEPDPFAQEPAMAAAPIAAVPEVLPERMKANKKTMGRVCVVCNVPIELGDDIHNCQECMSTMHTACYNKANACGNPDCSLHVLVPEAKAAPGKNKLQFKKNTGPKMSGGAMKPCRFCGEEIAAVAKKCRYCGEFQKEIDRKLQKQRASGGTTDEELSWGEILLAIFCSGIACIVAIVYICQGKKKGGKLLLIAIIVQIIAGAIRVMLERS